MFTTSCLQLESSAQNINHWLAFFPHEEPKSKYFGTVGSTVSDEITQLCGISLEAGVSSV